MAAVHGKVSLLAGVTVVAMDLVVGGMSPLIVTSRNKLGPDAVRDAVEHVGFGVPLPKRREGVDLGGGPASAERGTQPKSEAMLVLTGG